MTAPVEVTVACGYCVRAPGWLHSATPCPTCGGSGTVNAALVGRDALVMELGRAMAAYNRAIDVWAPLKTSRAEGWREALDAMNTARDALGVAGTALRQWDAGTEGGGT